VSDDPLGSPDSWLHDGMLAGALLPNATLCGALLTTELLDGRLPQPPDLGVICAMSLLAVAGGFLGVLLGPLAGLLARTASGVPLLVWAVGPLLGGCCAWLAQLPLDLSAPHRAMVTSAGALTLGPPWVAYVAVRSQGRSGTPVVLATTCWAALVAVLLVSLEWLHH
jgi:hypothetical protein